MLESLTLIWLCAPLLESKEDSGGKGSSGQTHVCVCEVWGKQQRRKIFSSKKTPTHRSPREGTDDTTNTMQGTEGLLPSFIRMAKAQCVTGVRSQSLWWDSAP